MSEISNTRIPRTRSLLTGSGPLYLRANLHDNRTPPKIAHEPLWRPPAKIAGRYLTGFLAEGGSPGDRLSDRPPRRPRATSPR